MSDWPTVTKLFMLSVTCLVILYDIIAIWCGGMEASISVNLKKLVFENPIIALAAGIILGHIVWPN